MEHGTKKPKIEKDCQKFTVYWLLLFVNACVHYFLSNFYFSPNDSSRKLWKMYFVSSKKLLSFSKYLNFCTPSSPLFLHISHCFRGCSKINFKVYDVINCLNEKLITHFVLYLRSKKGMKLKLSPLIEY